MARRFRFPLAALLRLREQREEERKREFAAAAQAARAEQARREALVGDRQSMQDEIVRMYADKKPFSQITDVYREIAWVSGEVLRSEAEQARLDQLLEEARRLLVLAQRDRRAMEILRDRQREAFLREEARREQAEADEMGLRVRMRRLSEAAERESAAPTAVEDGGA